jgi:hypothetical protein
VRDSPSQSSRGIPIDPRTPSSSPPTRHTQPHTRAARRGGGELFAELISDLCASSCKAALLYGADDSRPAVLSAPRCIRVVSATRLSADTKMLAAERTAVELRLNPAMMPHASDQERWAALCAVGIHGPGRDGESTALPTFSLSVDDMRACTSHQLEPQSVALLRFVIWLLVAAKPSLSNLLTLGKHVDAIAERGAIGRALVALVDFNASCLDGAPTEAAGDGALRETLQAWRDIFVNRFGVVDTGQSLAARWTQLQVRAYLARPD